MRIERGEANKERGKRSGIIKKKKDEKKDYKEKMDLKEKQIRRKRERGYAKCWLIERE